MDQKIIDDFVGNAHGNLARVKELLEQYPDIVNQNASWNEYAIEAAAQTGNKPIIELLLSKGAPTNICVETVLGHTDKVKALINGDAANARATGAHGISLLYHAVICNNKEIAKMILAKGVEVNIGEGGSPAIHGAVMFNQIEMITWLIAQGANINIKNYEGKTPLKAAIEGKKDSIAELLRKNGASE
jgi:ankyrin repeat protein